MLTDLPDFHNCEQEYKNKANDISFFFNAFHTVVLCHISFINMTVKHNKYAETWLQGVFI